MNVATLTDPTFHTQAVQAMFAAALITVLALTLLSAPYGRHARAGWGPTFDPRIGWIVMESPSVVLWGAIFYLTMPSASAPALIFLAVWFFHYVYRAFIYPFRMRVKPGDRMPILVAAIAVAFNTLNAVVNAPMASGGVHPWDSSWLTDPRFVVGIALFALGTWINRDADATLRSLRKPGDTGYRIPTGGLYGWITCPNYFGECLAWTGWAVATWSTAGLGFAVYTAANLVPRALQNHAWYQSQFPDYPKDRRAILPWIL
jgi:protein-S-isoprenylcysteine O-methyltransferase Ste14